MAKAKNWKKTSFIFRDSRLNAFDKMEGDWADVMKALRDYRTLGYVPEGKYKPYIYFIVEQWISEIKKDKEEYRIRVLSKKLGAYKTNYWRYWKAKFKEHMLEDWYSIDEIKKMIEICSR